MTDHVTHESDVPINDEDIAEVLTTMHQRIVQEEVDHYGTEYAALLGADIPKFSEFNYALRNERDKISGFSRMASNAVNLVNEQDRFIIRFLYKEYPFVKSQLSMLMSSLEGGACSVDKVGSVINDFLRQVQGGELPTEQVWNRPVVSTLPEWMEVVRKLPHLHMGHIDTFVEARDALKEAYTQF